jgi:hypothetical protein
VTIDRFWLRRWFSDRFFHVRYSGQTSCIQDSVCLVYRKDVRYIGNGGEDLQ